MRPKDRPLFSQVANALQAWILVRGTNAASLEYIGRSGYVPKPIECKAKTADAEKHSLVGLVVDPTIEPQAFSDSRLAKALSAWEDFVPELRKDQSPYSVIQRPGAPDHGAVTLSGNKIHGDYDLKGVILVGQESRNLSAVETLNGQVHLRGPLFYKIKERVRAGIGVDMIQHSSEEGYADHSDDLIDVFGPEGEVFLLQGKAETEAFYRERKRNVHAYDSPVAALRGQPGGKLTVIQGGKGR
jgi:hypothetical protein